MSVILFSLQRNYLCTINPFMLFNQRISYLEYNRKCNIDSSVEMYPKAK